MRIAGARHLHRLLFIRTDRLGETLLNLPAVAALQAALPESAVSLLVDPGLEPLLSGLTGPGGVLALPAQVRGSWPVRAWRLSRFLVRRRFDCAIVSNPQKELHAAIRLAGIPVRVGYARKWGCLLTHRVEDRKALGDRHEVEYNFTLIRALGLPATLRPWRFPPFSREQAEIAGLPELRGLQSSEPLVAVHPFSSTPQKRWPAERYRELIRRLNGRAGVRVVVVGGAEERWETAAVVPPDRPVANLVGRLTLRQLAALLQRARLLVSNDSGPVHLAAAVGTRVVALFGSSHPATGPKRWGPWGEGHAVIVRPHLTDITVEDVEEIVRRLLDPLPISDTLSRESS